MDIISINKAVNSSAEKFISQAEQVYKEKIENAAKQIMRSASQKPVILLSGPSGSGKTTTAKLIERYLDSNGYETHTLSMDNYFRPMSREEIELAALKKLDLESPARLDTDFLNDQLHKITRGEEVDIPKFSFKTNERVSSGIKLKRKKGELIILEGIHALNPTVTGDSDDITFRTYISVRTRLQYGALTLHPSKIRLMRRCLRDRNFRSRPESETVRMLPTVERGENLYITPYKHRAELEFDTFIDYEANVYKSLLLKDLSKLLEDYPEVAEIIAVLSELEEIRPDLVPADSLIREFIGGSELKY